MRLVDADALERQIQEAYCAECDDYNGIRCRACGVDDALIQVDAAPTIDAIPVEWLMDLANRGDFVYSAVVRWKHEQEAR